MAHGVLINVRTKISSLLLGAGPGLYEVAATLCREQMSWSRMEKNPIFQNDQKTLLVVDDDPQVLNSVCALLVDSNYKVLQATSGAEALQQSRDYKGEIHLLLSDFQMLGMSGVDLATKMTGERPQLKVLLMSGFT